MIQDNVIHRPVPRIRSYGVMKGVTLGLVISAFVALPLLAVLAPNRSSHKIVVLVIDDDPGWLGLISHNLGTKFEVITCQTYCDDPRAKIMIVDGQDANEVVVGPQYVRLLRPLHPDDFIVGISGRLTAPIPGQAELLSVQFIAAGANAVWDKGTSIDDLLALLPKSD